jgi:hypothetical protein
MRRIIILVSLLLFANRMNAQVLISLIFGDQINSGTVEFGLEGGLNYASIKGLDGKASNLFNIGFYFDIKTKNPKWLVSTGVKVKASLGQSGMEVYSLNDAGLDSSFKGGEVERKINYFNVPVMMKYKLPKNFFVQGGIMPSLRYTANDIFTNEIDGDELEYKNNVTDQFHRIDFGLIGGVGYRLLGGNGMNLGFQYYYGLTDITVDDGTNHYNRSVYFYLGIPIGAGKAKAREAKEK